MIGLVAWKPWDTRMGAARVAEALRVRLHTTMHYRCRGEGNDGSIALRDVDYFCVPVRGDGPGYWLGTSSSRITELQATG